MDQRLERIVPDKHRDLILRFFVMFSRFECALKRASYLDPRQNWAKPDWRTFEDQHKAFDPSTSPELADAWKHFERQPVQRQVVKGGCLCWENTPPPQPGGNNLKWILENVRLVRNNLFHGGKYEKEIKGLERNTNVLQYSLDVLDVCLTLDDRVKHEFWDHFI